MNLRRPRRPRPVAVATLAGLALAGTLAARSTGSAGSAATASVLPAIRPEAIRAHMRFLSAGQLEGRAPDSRGYALAAAYVAAQLEALGLKPAAAGGSYLQKVPMRKATLDEERSSFVLIRDGKEERLDLPGECFLLPDRARTETTVEGPVVFAGFGITAPELQHDDYAGIDAKGKIVATVWGAPSRFEATERAHFSSNQLKQENAAAHGAIGYIALMTPDDLKRYRWDWLLPQARAGTMGWLDDSGTPNDSVPAIRGIGRLNDAGGKRLLQGAPKAAETIFAAVRDGKPPVFDLPVKARLTTFSKHTGFDSSNIVGLLPGSDARLRDEQVVVSAHLDHLGLCPPREGDNVCHGAYDNASGVAVLLELARVFASQPPAPRRSLLFAVVTGEEKGLLGSDYLSRHPVGPGTVVADVNIDGAPGILYPLADVVALGIEHSSLKQPVEEAARAVGYALSPDPMPEESIFVRSDQYSFVRQGVPSVFLVDGGKSSAPDIDGLALTRTWMTTLYHTPGDSMAQKFDFDSAAQGARFCALITEKVAQAAARPTWNRGDFFGVKYGR
ncbi:MAG TPA: M28 family metallopeptidase [Candidatus Polarisedimenticolia bacterium]|nr:M28 family metallopeptidase [Candidatus Polarisedimenticolia bacterium]